jgi:chromosome segregation ATPase
MSSSTTIIEELADDLEMQKHETENLRRAYADAVSEIRDMECRLDSANRRIRQVKEESRQTRDSYLDLKERHEVLKTAHEDLEEEMAALSRDYRTLRADYFDMEDRLAKRRRRE